MTDTMMDDHASLRANLLASRDRWPDDVRIWRLDRADDPAWLAMRDKLTPDEQTRAARFLRPADQARFIATRATLRALLAAECDVPPLTLRFETGAYGRPSLAHAPTRSFNVSHSGTYALVAISAKRTVGIDVERIDACVDWQALARRVCTRDEWAAIARLPAARQIPQFFRCWTAKEALLKALGIGIGDALQSLSVDLTREANAGEQQPVLHGDKATAAATLRFHWIDDIEAVGSLQSGSTAPTTTTTTPTPTTPTTTTTTTTTTLRSDQTDVPADNNAGYSACVAFSAAFIDIS